ncbi:hypothetical protein [Paenibacillus sp. FSL H3-0457]|uniref:hypothetical protein n=1 Tax=Paenibacillus sp. FSL H3-0457 TaxID=2921430 RepID=UPI0030ED04CE
MLKSVSVYLLLFLLCTSCTLFDEYEQSMEQARNAMKSSDYAKALESLNVALIEQPNNADAVSLKKMAEENLAKQQEEIEHDKFLEVFTPIYEKLSSWRGSIGEEIEFLTITEAEILLPQVEKLQNEIEANIREWQSSSYSIEIGYLDSATESLYLCIIAIIENISEPVELNGDHSRSNVIKQMLRSNDFKIRADFLYTDFKSSMNRFEELYNKHK